MDYFELFYAISEEDDECKCHLVGIRRICLTIVGPWICQFKLGAVTILQSVKVCERSGSPTFYSHKVPLGYTYWFNYWHTCVLNKLLSLAGKSAPPQILRLVLRRSGLKSRLLQLNFQLEKGCGRYSMRYAIKYGCIESNLK